VAEEVRRKSQQGKGRPIISTEFKGYRLTAVGNRLHYSKKHKTFIDFLGSYIRSVLSPEWENSEISKSLEKRHQISKWYDAICALQRATMKKPPGEIQDMPINGLICCYYGLAYNLYLLQHNAELQQYLINRIKRSESFYAAYYETFVAAWFILAGFSLRIEDEKDSSSTHPEFIATRNGKSYSVEAKSRQFGKDHFDIGNQLYNGLCKEAHHQRVIFVDMNVDANLDYEDFRDRALAAVHDRESRLTVHGQPASPAFVFLTNQPYHLLLNETQIQRVCLLAGFKIPDFGHGVRCSSYTEAYKTRLKYCDLLDVQKAMENYRFPVTFDGEVPEFAFGDAKRRFSIGERLEISDATFVTIQSGIVIEKEQKACLVVDDCNGQSHLMFVKLSIAELAAYRSHPETFFGRVLQASNHIEDPVDLYEFYINSCKDTPRDKLLDFMKNASDYETIKKLANDELLFVYAERLTFNAVRENEIERHNKGLQATRPLRT